MPSYKDSNGKWYCKFYYKDWNGESKQKKKSGFKLKRDADEYERKFLEYHTSDANITVGTLADRYLELNKPNWKAQTYYSKCSVTDNLIRPYLGNTSINEVTPLMIIEWTNKIRETGIKDTTLKTYVSVLKAMMNFAVVHFGLDKSPVNDIKIKTQSREMNFWTIEEYREFMTCDLDLQYKLAVKALYWTGLRVGELLALTPNDLKDGYISVNKNIISAGYRRIIQDSPKTSNSRRNVKVHESLMAELRDLAVKEMLNENNLIFDFTNQTLGYRIKQGCNQTGVKIIRVHDIRHSHVALMIHLGYGTRAIADRIGDNPAVVDLIYSHIYESDVDRMIDNFSELDN